MGRSWGDVLRRTVDTRTKLIRAFCLVGAAMGVISAMVYFIITPVRYDSVSVFVVAPNSLASNANGPTGSMGGAAAALSLLGGTGAFSEVDVYQSQIRSHDLMASFLSQHPDLLEGYRPYFRKGFPTITRDGSRILSPDVADTFRSDYVRITPTSAERIFQLTVSAPDPNLAARVATALLATMNAKVRNSALREHQGRVNFLREQLATAANVDLRTSITQLATEELRMLTLVAGSPDYGVEVIDTPSVPTVRAWPRLSIVLALGFINGLLLGGFIYWIIYSRRWF